MVVVFDLDDTLYDEIDFVQSGFHAIANYLGQSDYYDFLHDIFLKEGSGKVLNALINEFKLDTPLQKLIEIYRFHTPDIKLPQESVEVLRYAQQYKTALISDGHYLTQENKFHALSLKQYIAFAVFTDFYHTKKPEMKPFQMVMDRYHDEKKFVYISDNPKKDFIAPHKLGWETIRYKNPHGIYKDIKNSATFEISNRYEMIDLLKEIHGA